MSISDLLLDERRLESPSTRVAGVVVAVVTNNKDEEGLGRVKVRFPWLSDADESPWARIAAPMAGNGRGMYFLPEIDDEVLVAFEQGDIRFPYVVGVLWNGKDAPPAKNDDGKNDVRLIKSRSGHVIRLNDKDGAETIEVVDKTGKNLIVIDSAKNSIAITSEKDITIAAPNGTVTIDAKTLTLKSSGDAKMEAGGSLKLDASNSITLNGSAIHIN